jgi:hypothetical protein
MKISKISPTMPRASAVSKRVWLVIVRLEGVGVRKCIEGQNIEVYYVDNSVEEKFPVNSMHVSVTSYK